jgi:hypothetical protein
MTTTYIEANVAVPFIRRPPVQSENEKFVLGGNANEILPRLFLGNFHSAAFGMGPALAQLGITGVVICAKDGQMPFHHSSYGVECARVACSDNEGANILPYLKATSDFIAKHHDRGNAVLVCCMQGVSRSSTVMIASLMKLCKLSRDAAYVHVKSRRSLVNPNQGFWKQLEQYEEVLHRATDTAAENEDRLSQLKLDDDWCRASCAKFHACGDAFGDVSGCSDRDVTNKALEVGFEFVLSRGVQRSDKAWLAALYREIDCSTSVARSILFDELFQERWGCDFKEEQFNELLGEMEGSAADEDAARSASAAPARRLQAMFNA